MIRLDGVGYVYQSGTVALSGATARFLPSQLTAIIGPNGAGKSTVARLVTGLLQPTSGLVEIDGLDTRATPSGLIRRLVGLAWQNPDNQLVCGVVEDDLAFGPENLGLRPKEIISKVDEIVERLDLKAIKHASVHSLSSAQKQLVAVAGAMAIGPRYLILDEVTARLDPTSAHNLLEAVTLWAREHNAGIIMITHQLSEVLRADSVCRLEISPSGGRIAAQGSPAEIMRGAKFSDEVTLESPLYDTLFRLEQLGVHLEEMPETVDGLVEALCH